MEASHHFEAPVVPAQPRRRSSLQFEKQQLEKIVNASLQGDATAPARFYTGTRRRSGSQESLGSLEAQELPTPPNPDLEGKKYFSQSRGIALSLLLVCALVLIVGSNVVQQATDNGQVVEENQAGRGRVLSDIAEIVEDTAATMPEQIIDGRDLAAKKKNAKLPVNADDLAAWKTLVTDLNGKGWRSCNNANKPCDQGKACKGKVKCKAIDGERRIVSIKLKNNKLSGMVPGKEIQNRMTALQVIDLSNDPKKKNQNKLSPPLPCFDLPRCLMEPFDLECNFENAGMENYLAAWDDNQHPIFDAEVLYCLPTQLAIEEGDLLAWRDLYQLAGGENWTHCSDLLNDPCSCQTDKGVYVTCQWSVGSVLRITAISLRNNNLVGRLPPSLMFLDDIEKLDFTENPHLTGCLNAPQCGPDQNTAGCRTDSGVALCDGTSPGGEIPDTWDPARLDPLDLAVWQNLFQSLEGSSWNRCQNSFLNPCAFPSCVKCALTDSGAFRIISIDLNDNGMIGELPITDLARLGPSLKSFTATTSNENDIETRNLFLNPFTTCISLPTAITWDLTNSGLVICEPNMGPGRGLKEVKVNEGDLSAFQELYDALDGKNWKHCAASRDDPCSPSACESNLISFDRIICTQVSDELRITEVVLQDAGLRGTLPIASVEKLDQLVILDLSNTPFAKAEDRNVFSAAENLCADVKLCKEKAYCVFGSNTPCAQPTVSEILSEYGMDYSDIDDDDVYNADESP